MKIEDKVAYIKHDGTFENGMVKSLSDKEHVFVVYHCNDDWYNFQDYTAARTPISQLVIGWRE